jgi:hypothetical protein
VFKFDLKNKNFLNSNYDDVTYTQSHVASPTAADVAVPNKQELSDVEKAVADVQQADVEVVGHKLVFKY